MELLNKYLATETWYFNSEIRYNLLNHIDKNQKYDILEIGSFEGLSACGFSDNIMNHPETTLDCVDPFIISGTHDKITTKKVTSNTEKIFTNNINLSKNGNKIKLYKQTSDDFFKTNQKFYDLIYIDGCHEPEFIKNDIDNSFKFIKKNGIIWIDDYGGNTSYDGKIKIHIDNNLKNYENSYIIIHKNYQLAIKKI